ncbi:Crp/Fnr family transcriptional regulator [Bradyrhizobium sp.]|uniref:Crp/Fnr family transcriptional regulator n=1 Tax=Bradyrhizobium sp. TaxID=376 RepID=UPI003C73378F
MPGRSHGRGSIAPFDPNVFLAEAGSGKNLERFQKKQKIYVQGDPADTVCYLRKGRVKATVLSDHGREAIVGIHQTGQFFGEASLADARLRTATTVALEECLITFITKEAMLSTLNSEPAFSAFFVSRLLSRNTRLEEDLTDQLLNSSERRLARILLVLATSGQEADKPHALTFSQDELAEMVGATRSRVSTFMNRFREKGFISYDSHSGRIEVCTALLLSVLGL